MHGVLVFASWEVGIHILLKKLSSKMRITFDFAFCIWLLRSFALGCHGVWIWLLGKLGWTFNWNTSANYFQKPFQWTIDRSSISIRTWDLAFQIWLLGSFVLIDWVGSDVFTLSASRVCITPTTQTPRFILRHNKQERKKNDTRNMKIF